MSDSPNIDAAWIRDELARAAHAPQTVTIPGSTWAAVLTLAAAHLRESGVVGTTERAQHTNDSDTPSRKWDTGDAPPY
jgi:hypothetical protein